jgi:hypothetical protein
MNDLRRQDEVDTATAEERFGDRLRKWVDGPGDGSTSSPDFRRKLYRELLGVADQIDADRDALRSQIEEGDEVAEAGARLIAAAPELASALEGLLVRHRSFIECLPGESGLSDIAASCAALRKAGRLE